MKPWIKGLVIAAVQVGLVTSLGAKLLYDRATQPRLWVLAVPYDPSLPIRGRYVRLQLVVETKGLKEPETQKERQPRQPVTLHFQGGRLVAEASPPKDRGHRSPAYVRFTWRDGKKLAVLDAPLAFFIPEHIPDPSRRPQGEELWVEVTLPQQGPPRPIRLGVKKGDAPIVPLPLR